jgi:hypothetical protein
LPKPETDEIQVFHSEKQSNENPRRQMVPRTMRLLHLLQPEFICDEAKGDKCEFPDVVLPLCWAVFQKRNWVDKFLGQLGGEHVKTDEKKFMSWLGKQQQVFGEAKASRAHAVADFVFQQMESDHQFW